MPLPTGRPDTVLHALSEAFRDREVWPAATTNPGVVHQRLGVMNHYLAGVAGGFVLTDLGAREVSVEREGDGSGDAVAALQRVYSALHDRQRADELDDHVLACLNEAIDLIGAGQAPQALEAVNDALTPPSGRSKARAYAASAPRAAQGTTFESIRKRLARHGIRPPR